MVSQAWDFWVRAWRSAERRIRRFRPARALLAAAAAEGLEKKKGKQTHLAATAGLAGKSALLGGFGA